MPLEYVQGDLFRSDCDVIGHGCNCFNSFGAGIALQMMNEHMPAWWADQATLRGDKSKLGGFTHAEDKGRRVYNLYTQYSFSRTEVSADYAAIEASLIAMKEHLQDDKIFHKSKIGLPKLGAGLAMGDWDTIAGHIERAFPIKKIHIYYL